MFKVSRTQPFWASIGDRVGASAEVPSSFDSSPRGICYSGLRGPFTLCSRGVRSLTALSILDAVLAQGVVSVLPRYVAL